MANSGKITEIIDTAATTGQYKTLSDQLDALDLKFVELTKDVLAFNTAAKDAKGFADFNKNAGQAAIAAEKLLQVQNQTAITAAKLAEQENKLAMALQKSQDVRDKNAAKQAAQTQKDIADSQKRTAQTDKEAEANAKALLKSYQNVEKARGPYALLNADLERLRLNAKNIGADFGIGSKAFRDAAFEVRSLDKQIKDIDTSLGQNGRNVGNYAGGFSKAFGVIRQAAFILPGIGVAGIFNVLGEGIVQLVDAVKGGQSILQLNRDLIDRTTEAYAKQSVQVKLLVAELNSANTVGIRRTEIIEELNKISPTYFGNLKSEEDIVKNLKGDYDKYNEALKLSARIKAAEDLIGEKYKEQLTAELQLVRLRTDVPVQKGYLGFLQQYAQVLEKITSFGQVNQKQTKDLFEGIEENKIKGLATNIKQLTDIATKAQQDLQKNGGSIDGSEIQLQQRITNNFTEQQKIKVQSVIDTNNDIVANDKKSYSARQIALSTSIAAQKQLLGLSLNEELNDIALTNDKKAVIEDQYNRDITKINIDYDKQSRDLRSKAAKDEIDLENQRLERQKKIAENKFTDPTLGYQDRFKALETYQNASIALIRNTEKIAVQDAGDNAAKRKTAEEKAGNDILDVKNDIAKKTLSIQKDVNEENAKLRKQELDSEVAAEKALENIYTNAANDRLLAIDQNYSQQASALAAQYASGEIKVSEYNSRIAKLEQDTAQERIQVQIDTTRKIIAAQAAAAALGFGDPKALQKSASDLVKLQIQQSDLLTKTEIDNVQKVEAAKKKKNDLEKELADSSLQLIQTLIDSGFQKQINVLQEQSKQLDINSTQEKDRIENSLASTQEKAKREKIIDAQTAASKQDIANRESKIKHDQAVFDKAVSIARIIEATAVAEIEALTYISNPLTAPFYPAIAALIGTLSAVQLATIIATPIPAYKDGIDSHPGGKAIVGDGGMPELVKLPNGNSFLSEPRATLMDLPKGTTVVPGLETVNMLQKINYVDGQKLDMREANALLKENNRYQKKIADKPTGTNHKGLASEMANALRLNDRRNSFFK